MNTTDISDRELDCMVLENIFGYKMLELNPEWYSRPVKCFYLSNGGHMQYSYDDNGCNALMFKNGENEKDGYAQPVPGFSTDLITVWAIVDKLLENTGIDVEIKNTLYREWMVVILNDGKVIALAESSTVTRAICCAALLFAEKV